MISTHDPIDTDPDGRADRHRSAPLFSAAVHPALLVVLRLVAVVIRAARRR